MTFCNKTESFSREDKGFVAPFEEGFFNSHEREMGNGTGRKTVEHHNLTVQHRAIREKNARIGYATIMRRGIGRQ